MIERWTRNSNVEEKKETNLDQSMDNPVKQHDEEERRVLCMPLIRRVYWFLNYSHEMMKRWPMQQSVSISVGHIYSSIILELTERWSCSICFETIWTIDWKNIFIGEKNFFTRRWLIVPSDNRRRERVRVKHLEDSVSANIRCSVAKHCWSIVTFGSNLDRPNDFLEYF